MSAPQDLLADRYRLERLIGKGGMGVVWEAWDEHLGRPVAVKQLRIETGVTDVEAEQAVNRAMREARITARLHHPHAVLVFDAVEHEGRPCLIMQYVPSTPLSAVLRESGPISPHQAARVGVQVASALSAAHELGIVHRDVKPGNILIGEDGAALISDFGISHALGDATITSTGLVHGTPAYLSPEVARGRDSSYASDVFSLGSTLYACVEGEPPFGLDSNPIAVLHRVASADFVPPKRAGVLTPLILAMLAVEPADRPSMVSVAAQLASLEAAWSGGSESPTRPLIPLAAPPVVEDLTPSPDPVLVGPAEVTGPGAEPEPVPVPEPLPDPDPEPEEQPEPQPEPALVGAAVAAREAAPPAPPVSRPAAPAAAPAELEPRRSRRWIGILIAAVALLAAIAFVVSGVMRGQFGPGVDSADDGNGTGSGAQPSSSGEPTPQETTEETPEAPEPEPEETAEEPPAEEAPPARDTQPADAITYYYTLVPGNTDEAWPRMTANYQENHAGRRDAYEQFWGAISAVSISDVVVTGSNAVEATLRYTFNDGRVDIERTAYQLVSEGGILKIAATQVLSHTSG